MRNLILSALLLTSAFQTALGEQDGEWIYSVENNQATITGYTGAGGAVTIPSEVNGIPVVIVRGNQNGGISFFGNAATAAAVTSVTIPNSVTSIGQYAFAYCSGLTSITIPNSVTTIEPWAFTSCNGLTSITIPNSVTSIGQYAFAFSSSLYAVIIGSRVTSIGQYAFTGPRGMCIIFPSTAAMPAVFAEAIPASATVLYMDALQVLANNDAFVTAMANNDAFVAAVANKIKETGGNYGIATQSGLSSAITTAVEPLATKSELTSALTESRTAGVNSVLSNPNLWTLYTTSQIKNMAVGDLVLTRQVGGGFVLNYDIEQSTDLQTWTPYQALSLPLTGLPTDKAFVRIKAKQ